jgi:hypothetical protein
MVPDKSSAIGLFRAPKQFSIPLFQRGYVWTLEKQVVPLWADIEDRTAKLLEQIAVKLTAPAALRKVQNHFLGSIVVTRVASSTFGRVETFEVIDGQQRTTTLYLLLLAFRHAAQDMGLVSAAQIVEPLLRNPGPYPGHAHDRYKVWPTRAGRDEMELLSGAASVADILKLFPARTSKQSLDRPLMVQAFLYMYGACVSYLCGLDMAGPEVEGQPHDRSNQLVKSVREGASLHLPAAIAPDAEMRAEQLYVALDQLMQVMVLMLDGEDDPQVIFETLNARGEPLLASDLIRNFVFLRAAGQDANVDALYTEYWQQFDQERDDAKRVRANKYWREKQRQGRLTHPRIDLFFYHYTLLRCKTDTKVPHVFSAFKEWWQSEPRDIASELARVVAASERFRQILTPVGTGAVAEFGRLIRGLDVASVTPVVLALQEELADDDVALSQALQDLGSYIVRRTVCGLTKKNFNRIFMQLIVVVQSGRHAARELRRHLLTLRGESQYWPSDEEFEDAWLHAKAYKELRAGRVITLLRALELAEFARTTRDRDLGELSGLTVEHVLPQKWEAHYPLATPDDAARALRETHLHSFGNLALLTQSLNSRVSNGPFVVVEANGKLSGKRVHICKDSLLATNAYFQDLLAWSDHDITVRGAKMFDVAVRLWPKPSVPPEVEQEAVSQ